MRVQHASTEKLDAPPGSGQLRDGRTEVQDADLVSLGKQRVDDVAPEEPRPPTTRDRTTESTDAGRNWRAEDSSLQNLHMRRLQPGRLFELAGRPGAAGIDRFPSSWRGSELPNGKGAGNP